MNQEKKFSYFHLYEHPHNFIQKDNPRNSHNNGIAVRISKTMAEAIGLQQDSKYGGEEKKKQVK